VSLYIGSDMAHQRKSSKFWTEFDSKNLFVIFAYHTEVIANKLSVTTGIDFTF
jgi:hypothetical protein